MRCKKLSNFVDNLLVIQFIREFKNILVEALRFYEIAVTFYPFVLAVEVKCDEANIPEAIFVQMSGGFKCSLFVINNYIECI